MVAKIQGGVMVTLPDSLELITPYVVREQEDWFEDEIKFVRELMQPGMRAIDIGSNYGLYALSMASKVGVSGHVWAFEPASSTASYLKRSIALNKFSNVTVAQCALSDRVGTAKLGLNINSELNALRSENNNTSETEDVSITTLDRYTIEQGCEQVEFVKLDAEGEESNIIRGGVEFFKNESPLVMYEIRHGQQLNFYLVRLFEEQEYIPYILVPGLNILAPFNSMELMDPLQLNLFCCKNDRARRLEKLGFLVLSLTDAEMPDASNDLACWQFLESKPFAKRMISHWRKKVGEQPFLGWHDLKKAIELYSIAHDSNQNNNSRVLALKSSYELLAKLCKESPNLGRLCSFARIARELGYRWKAFEIIDNAATLYARQGATLKLDEPFLPASPRFDAIDPDGRISDWLMASMLELGFTCPFSSYYTGITGFDSLETLLDTGFASLEMERRRQLIRMRYGLQSE